MDINIEPLESKENILLIDNCIEGNKYNFIETVGSNGFYDSELDLFVFDNMNGLIAINDSDELEKNNYKYIHTDEIAITQSSKNETLDEKFKNRQLKKINNNVKRGKINDEITHYNNCPTLVSEYISFYRKIVGFEKNNK